MSRFKADIWHRAWNVRYWPIADIAPHCDCAALDLDQAILAKAFQGELVQQDPNDEPASVLLERIRAERQETPIFFAWPKKTAEGFPLRSIEAPY
jgi:hypothetical protein